MTRLNVIAAALAMAVAGQVQAGVPDAQFKANSALAASNAASKAGAAYDAALGKAIDASADFPVKATACLRQFPGDHVVQGYFEIRSAANYRVVLQPDDGFGQCFSRALEGRALPVPPSLPYFNPFAFTNHPGKPATKKIIVTKDMLRETDGSPLKQAPPPAPAKKP